MSTINPLFVDSTKPIGDKVVTNVELVNLILHDGDTVYFEVTDEFGFTQRFSLKAIATKKSVKYTTEAWLKYQHQIQYRFIIESEGQQVYASAMQKARAGHVICEKWEPCFKSEVTPAKADKRSFRRNDSTKAPKQVLEIKSTSTKPLCKPQFFDQIKSLLDDLL